MQMQTWRKVWRDGFAPLMDVKKLEALKSALEQDDPRLVQKATTNPPPLEHMLDRKCEGACAISFCGWSEGLETVGEVEEFFANTCFAADERMGEPGVCRYFLNWFDETPREQMRQELLAEVKRSIKEKRRKFFINIFGKRNE